MSTQNKLKNIIAKHWSRISETLTEIPAHVFKSFTKVLQCRTEELGCHLYRCPDCGERVIVRHSCKDRFCSSCGTAYTDYWAHKTTNMLSAINCEYFFLTFTIPRELEEIAKNNKKLVLDFLFKASWHAVKSYYRKKKVIAGMISQLQTAGRWLNWHPHIHALCTFGGLTLDLADWKNVFLNAKSINDRFKSYFLKLLRKSFKNGQLKTNYKTYQEFNKFLNQQYQKHWQFDRSGAIESVKAIVTYISRYLLKPPISDLRIKWFNYKTICFSYKNYLTDLPEKAYLSLTDFFSRLIHHVQPPSFHITRNYGIFSSRSKTKLYNKAIQLRPASYGVQLFMREPKKTFRERTKDKTGKDPLLCPKSVFFTFSFFNSISMFLSNFFSTQFYLNRYKTRFVFP
jgi:hypothetical protein